MRGPKPRNSENKFRTIARECNTLAELSRRLGISRQRASVLASKYRIRVETTSRLVEFPTPEPG